MRISGDDQTLKAVALKAVKKVEPQCGSRMAAYQKIASVIGVSASYLRKFITVEDTPEPRWSVGQRLISYYRNVCDQLDTDVQAERSEIASLLGELHAPIVSLRTPPIPPVSEAGLNRRAGDPR